MYGGLRLGLVDAMSPSPRQSVGGASHLGGGDDDDDGGGAPRRGGGASPSLRPRPSASVAASVRLSQSSGAAPPAHEAETLIALLRSYASPFVGSGLGCHTETGADAGRNQMSEEEEEAGME